MYLSLHTADPQKFGIEATEVRYPEYERVCLDGEKFEWRGNDLVNSSDIEWPQRKIGRISAGIVTHIGMVDQPSGPSTLFKPVLLHNTLDLDSTPDDDLTYITPRLAAGALVLNALPDTQGADFVSAN